MNTDPLDGRSAWAALDAVAALVVVLDPDGRIQRFNRACERLSGYSALEVRDRAFWELLLPASEIQGSRAAFERLAAADFPLEHENHWLSRSGERRLIAWTSTAVLDERGEITRVVGTGLDVTEARRLEAELRSERDFAVQVMDAMGQGLVVEGADERFVYANAGLARMLGMPAEALSGLRPYDVVDPEDHELLRAVQERRQGGASDAYELRFRRADGRRVPVLVAGVPWRRDGRMAGSIAVITDLTEQKRAERALAERTAEAEALAEFSKLLGSVSDLGLAARGAVATLERAVPFEAGLLAFVEGERAAFTTIWRSPAATDAVSRPRPLSRDEGLLWEAIEQDEPTYVDDYAARPGARSEAVAAGISSVAFLPLADGSTGRPAVFLAIRTGEPRAWSQRERQLLEAAGRSARVALDRHRRLREAREAARTDALTGLGNRRAFETDLEAELARAARHGLPLSVLVSDLDGLKALNDREGHDRGDALIREFGRALTASVRLEDRVYRLGGDEFAAVLAHTGPPGAPGALERVRAAVRRVRAGGFANADASAGIAAFPLDATTPGELVRLADARMYEQKRSRLGGTRRD